MKKNTKNIELSVGANTELAPKDFSAENLIAQAIDKNVPIETMEKLLQMRRELKADWAKEQFDRAMAAFQGECPIIEKTKKVDFTSKRTGHRTNYSYAPLDVIVKQAGPYLSKNGLSYTTTTEISQVKIKAIVRATHIAGHSQDSSFEVDIDKESYMNPAQQAAAALTYAKRYAFCNAFGILTGDEDTDSSIPETEQPQEVSPIVDTKEKADSFSWGLKLETTTSLEELKKVWSAVPPKIKLELESIKETLKQKYEGS